MDIDIKRMTQLTKGPEDHSTETGAVVSVFITYGFRENKKGEGEVLSVGLVLLYQYSSILSETLFSPRLCSSLAPATSCLFGRDLGMFGLKGDSHVGRRRLIDRH